MGKKLIFNHFIIFYYIVIIKYRFYTVMQGNTKKDATFENLTAQRATAGSCSVGELVANLPGATGPNLLFYDRLSNRVISSPAASYGAAGPTGPVGPTGSPGSPSLVGATGPSGPTGYALTLQTRRLSQFEVFTVPENVYYFQISASGGGGGGGNGDPSGSGGGGGSVASATGGTFFFTPGDAINVRIGLGGGPGEAGQPTIVFYSGLEIILFANGGDYGGNGAPGTGGNGANGPFGGGGGSLTDPGTYGAGGLASSGNVDNNGQPGTSAGGGAGAYGDLGAPGGLGAGAGGGGSGTGAGAGANFNDNGGNAQDNSGAGGGGGSNAGTGGRGGSGYVYIQYYT